MEYEYNRKLRMAMMILKDRLSSIRDVIQTAFDTMFVEHIYKISEPDLTPVQVTVQTKQDRETRKRRIRFRFVLKLIHKHLIFTRLKSCKQQFCSYAKW